MKILSTAVLALGVFAVGAMVPQHLTAGWGPPVKKAVRVDPRKGASGGGWGPARRPVGAQNVPTIQWDGADSATLEKASNSGKPIVVLFPKEGTDITTYFSGQEYVDMKDGDAVFIAIPYTSDRTPAPGAKESIVPISPLTSDNPARDFKIGVREEVVLVLDCYGNLSSVGMKFTRKPSAKELKDVIAQMPKKIDTLNKKLEKDLKSVTTALEKGDRIKAFKDAVKILESGVVGYNASAEAAKVYNDICDQVRAEIAELKGADPKEAQSKLNELGNVFTKKAAPGIAAEIASAKKDVVVVAK